MAHYSIYIPKASAPKPALLDQVGLPGLIRDGDFSPLMIPVLKEGPDGGDGLLFTWVDTNGIESNPTQGFSADKQHWEPAPPDPAQALPAGRYWFGVEKDRPPTPEDLQRRSVLPGFHAPLADGNEWRLPNAQQLPHRFGMGADGRETRVVKVEYREIFDRMAWCYDAAEAFVRYGSERDPRQFREYLAYLLMQNYRINLPLCYWLMLFDETNWWGAAMGTVDYHALFRIEEELEKKNTASPPST